MQVPLRLRLHGQVKNQPETYDQARETRVLSIKKTELMCRLCCVAGELLEHICFSLNHDSFVSADNR